MKNRWPWCNKHKWNWIISPMRRKLIKMRMILLSDTFLLLSSILAWVSVTWLWSSRNPAWLLSGAFRILILQYSQNRISTKSSVPSKRRNTMKRCNFYALYLISTNWQKPHWVNWPISSQMCPRLKIKCCIKRGMRLSMCISLKRGSLRCLRYSVWRKIRISILSRYSLIRWKRIRQLMQHFILPRRKY